LGLEVLKRQYLLWLTAVFAVVAVLLAVSGGVRATVGGVRLSARSPVVPIILADVAAVAWFLLAKREAAVARDLGEVWEAIDRHAAKLIAAVALLSAAIAFTFATGSASGADASGYLSQAELLSEGHAIRGDQLGLVLNDLDPNGFLTTPLGWRPFDSAAAGPPAGSGLAQDRPRPPHAQVPSYPPGLPILMAVPHRIAGTAGAAVVIPVCAAIAVWSVGAIGVVLAGGIAGLLSAIVLASTPIFLFQSVQPMSDVPVTAAWMLCWWLVVRKGSGASGASGACAIAVLIRPNLAPLAAVPLAYLLLTNRQQAWRFAVPVAGAGLLLGFLQNLLYGSPFRSGYGDTAALFAAANVGPNLLRYFGWVVDTSPVMFVSLCGAYLLRKRRDALALIVFAGLVAIAYLVYAVFDDWSYLRFLLPALAIGAIFVSAFVLDVANKAPVFLRPIVLVSLVLLLMAFGLYEARARDTFKLAEQQQRVAQIAQALVERTAPNDVMLTGEQSGSMRYYTRREIVRWDELRPDQWDRLLTLLTADKRAAWIVLDAFEEPLFREKFKSNPGGMLDWPPAIEAGDTHRTRAWRLSDHARFAAGDTVTTERIR
jgi:hypothetical protein